MEKNLNSIMELDHVIRVTGAGTVVDAPEVSPYFELYTYLQDDGQWSGDDQLSLPEGWELLKGFTGQHGYNGPVMHVSEFIGGGLERHILENPGYYVALEVRADCGGKEGCNIEQGCDCEPAGWVTAFKPCVMVRDVYHYGNVRTELIEPLDAVRDRLIREALHGATSETVGARRNNVIKAIATLTETGTDNSWGWHTLTVVEDGE